MDTSQDMTLCLNCSVMLLIIIQQFLGVEYSILDIFLQRFLIMMDLMDPGEEETLNPHWAVLSFFFWIVHEDK